jgi:hypothetical protein
MPKVLVTSAVALLCAAAMLAQTPTQPGNVPDNVAVRPIEPPAHPLPQESESARITKFWFIAYGDTRSGRPARAGEPAPDGSVVQVEHSAVVDAMLATARRLAGTNFPVRFVVSSGDAVLYGPNGTMWNVSYIPIIERITRAGLPFFYAPGNHDMTARPPGDPDRERGLRNTLDAMSRLMPPAGSPRRLDGYVTSSFGYGNAFFILFDSNIAADRKQLAWVTQQLEGLDRRRYHHVFAVFHHPPFDSGQYGGPKPQATSQAVRDLYLPLFRKHHVRMTIAGHDHRLDHFVEHYVDGGRTYRMDHVVSGGGGAPNYVYTAEPELESYIKANSDQHVRIDHLIKPGFTIEENPHHFLLIRVDGDKVSLEPIASNHVLYKPYGRQRLELKD